MTSAPAIANDALSVSPAPATSVYVNVSPASTSVVERAPTVVPTAAFSAIVEEPSATSVGASFASVTVIVNCFSVFRPPESVDRTRMLYEFLVSKSKTAAVFTSAPAIANAPLSALPAPATSVYVNVSPASTSVVESAPTVVPAAEFSATVAKPSAMSVGASFSSVTVIVNCFSVLSAPESVDLTLMLYELFVSKSKTAVVLTFAPAITNDALSVSPAPATSVYVKASPASTSVVDRAPTVVPAAEFSGTASEPNPMSVGASFSSVTVIVNALSKNSAPESVVLTLML